MKKKPNQLIPILDEFFTDYLPNVKGLSENSINAYQYAFQLLFRYLDEVKEFTTDKVTFEILSGNTIPDFLLYLEQERGCSVKTRNLRRAAILSFAKFAAKRTLPAALPFYSEMLELPKKREPREFGVKHFTKEEIAILLKLPGSAKIVEQRDVTLLSLLYATGARAQELCDITLGDITLGSPTKVKLTGKGNKTRVVTIPDACTTILKAYLRSKGFDLEDNSKRHRHLFSSQTHEHMSIACVEEVVKKYVTEAKKQNPTLFKEDRYSPHSFRHSIAIHMLESGDSLLAIKAFLGHTSVATTAVYAQVTPELASKYLDERGKPLKETANLLRPQPLSMELPFLYKRR
jgi:site-specific recombinase XerD